MDANKILEDAVLYLDRKMEAKNRMNVKRIWEDSEVEPVPSQPIQPKDSLANKENVVTDEITTGKDIEKEHKDLYDLLKKWSEDNNLSLPLSEDEFYTMIASAHVREIKDYYTRLTKMEAEAKQAKEITPIVKQDIQVKSDGVETV